MSGPTVGKCPVLSELEVSGPKTEVSGPKVVKVSDPRTESVRSKILWKISESVRSEKVKVSGPESNNNQLECWDKSD